MSCTECNNCNSTTTCGCTKEVSTNCITYEGTALECIGIEEGDDLELALEKINEFLCSIPSDCNTTSSEVTYDGVDIVCDMEIIFSGGETLSEMLNDLYARVCVLTQAEDGVDGVDGVDGLNFYQGALNPLNSFGEDNESYFNNITGDVFLKTGGIWVLTGNFYPTTVPGVTENDYLFFVDKTVQQAINGGITEISQVSFHDDTTAPLFDHGDNWHSSSYVAPRDLTDIVFETTLDLEIENVDAVIVPGASDALTTTVEILKNGVALGTSAAWAIDINADIPVILDTETKTIVVAAAKTDLVEGDIVTVKVTAVYQTDSVPIRDSYPVKVLAGKFFNVQVQ